MSGSGATTQEEDKKPDQAAHINLKVKGQVFFFLVFFFCDFWCKVWIVKWVICDSWCFVVYFVIKSCWLCVSVWVDRSCRLVVVEGSCRAIELVELWWLWWNACVVCAFVVLYKIDEIRFTEWEGDVVVVKKNPLFFFFTMHGIYWLDLRVNSYRTCNWFCLPVTDWSKSPYGNVWH